MEQQFKPLTIWHLLGIILVLMIYVFGMDYMIEYGINKASSTLLSVGTVLATILYTYLAYRTIKKIVPFVFKTPN